MVRYLALYHGDSISDARRVAFTDDPAIVEYVECQLLDGRSPNDHGTHAVRDGRRWALRRLGLLPDQEEAE